MTSISFIQDHQMVFKKVLHQRVKEHFAAIGLSKAHNREMVFKTVVMMSLYILPYLAIVFFALPLWMVFLLYVIMGVGIAGIGMSVMHDGNHAAYSLNQRVNALMGLTMNMMGADAYNWKIKHNKLHHVFTNIYGKDEDIDSRAILRFAYASPLKSYHRYQYIYAWFLYSLMTLSMVVMDIPKRFKYRKKGITNISPEAFRKSLALLIVSKLIYFGIIIVVPVVFTSLLWWQVLLGFLLMHLVAGSILAIIFQLAHVVEGPCQALPGDDGKIQDTLLIHQLKASCDFARNNKILSWYVGGLNFQTEHHLFPRICHVHYPALSKIVESTAREYNVPYYIFDTFCDALQSHIKTLKNLGKIKY